MVWQQNLGTQAYKPFAPIGDLIAQALYWPWRIARPLRSTNPLRRPRASTATVTNSQYLVSGQPINFLFQRPPVPVTITLPGSMWI
jgi:hypothetical protein